MELKDYEDPQKLIKQKLENTTKEIFYIINNYYNFEDLNKEENYKKC